MVGRSLAAFRERNKQRRVRATQLDPSLDLWEDRKNELSEFYRVSSEEIDAIHRGPKRHEAFSDVDSDASLFTAYQERTMVATISHMLSYTRFDDALCLMKTTDRAYRGRPRNEVRVLDYGCSIADYSLIFAASGYSIILCDIEDGNLELGKWRFARRGLPFEAIPVNLDNLYPKFEDIDVVIAGEVLEHVRDPLTATRNIFEGLREGGFLWVSRYPMVEVELDDAHPDHLTEAYDARNDVEEFIRLKFEQQPIERGYLFRKVS